VAIESYSSDSESAAKNGDEKTHSSSSSRSGSQMRLKYNYKDSECQQKNFVFSTNLYLFSPIDQWSPINKEGKKQYDRTFLLELQNDPLSQVKPINLPPIEGIVRDKSVAGSSRFSEDFTPGFVVRSLPQRVIGLINDFLPFWMLKILFVFYLK